MLATAAKADKPERSYLPILLVMAVLLQSVVNLVTLSEVRSLRFLQTAVGGNTTGISVGLPAGTEAPDFTLKNTNGRRVSLANYRGKRLLLMFSSPTCPYCVRLYPELRRFTETLQPADLTFVMLSAGTEEENSALKAKEDFAFEILAAGREQFIDYRIPGTPYFVLIAPNGKIILTETTNSAEGIAKIAASEK